MNPPIFPSLAPRIVDSLWFCVDKPCDDETELTQLEKEHQSWLTCIGQTDNEIIPIGKTATEHFDDEEEEDEDDDNDDDESESNEDEDEEIDADDINFEQDSPMFH